MTLCFSATVFNIFTDGARFAAIRNYLDLWSLKMFYHFFIFFFSEAVRERPLAPLPFSLNCSRIILRKSDANPPGNSTNATLASRHLGQSRIGKPSLITG